MIFLVGVLLLIFSILDWKFKSMPSVLLTGTIFLVLFFNQDHIFYGLLALVFALLMYEFEYFEGMADIKVAVIVGLMLNSAYEIMCFMFMTMIFGFVWVAVVRWRKKRWKEIPYVPVFFFVYVALLILRYL